MNRDDQPIPEWIKKKAASLRERARTVLDNQPFLPSTSMLDIDELELFSWYVNKTENILQEMRSDALAYIRQQDDAGREPLNESGMVAVDYYFKRVRYSHLIYLTSILETFLERWCQSLTQVLGPEHLPFTAKDLRGDQWSVRRKFLEGYGKFLISEDVWSGIQTLLCLRNNLVHDNGSTADLNYNDKKKLAKQPGIDLSGHFIVIEPAYIHSAVGSIKRLVQFVDPKLNSLLNRAVHPTLVTNPMARKS